MARKGLWRLWQRNWPVVAVLAVLAAVAGVHLVALRLSRQTAVYQTTNYSSLKEGLYQGGHLAEPPPGTQAVLNVGELEDPYTMSVHHWKMIPDRAPAPTLDWLREQVEFIDEQRRAGRPVFVHCVAGISRSSLVTTAYLMWRDRCTRDEALARIRTRRPIAEPNQVFMELLAEWEKTLLIPAGKSPTGKTSR